MIGFLSKAIPSSITDITARGSSHRKIIANTGWLAADYIIAIVAGLLVGALVARYLGPERYGAFNFALAFVFLFTPIVGLGLKDIVIRNTVRMPADKDEILGTALSLQVGGGLLAIGIAVLVVQLIWPDDSVMRWLVAILAARFVVQAFGDTLDYWFQSQVQAKYTVWARNIGLILISFVKIGLVLAGASLIAFAWAALGQVVVFTAALVLFHHFTRQKLSIWRPSFTRAKALLRSSSPLIISAVAITIYMRIGQVMLGTMAGAVEVGLYSAAIRFSELWYFIPVAISASVFPAIVRSLDADSEDMFGKRIQVYYDVMAGIAYVIVVPLVLIAPLVIQILFGSEYSGAGPILRVHILAFVFISLGVARSKWLVAEDMVRFDMLAAVLGAIVAIGMNFLLIPNYGALGVAWAVLVSQVISTYLSSVLSKKTWPAFSKQTLSLLIPVRVLSLRRSLEEIL